DYIRVFHVTGVQTCALPIFPWARGAPRHLALTPGVSGETIVFRIAVSVIDNSTVVVSPGRRVVFVPRQKSGHCGPSRSTGLPRRSEERCVGGWGSPWVVWLR